MEQHLLPQPLFFEENYNYLPNDLEVRPQVSDIEVAPNVSTPARTNRYCIRASNLNKTSPQMIQMEKKSLRLEKESIRREKEALRRQRVRMEEDVKKNTEHRKKIIERQSKALQCKTKSFDRKIASFDSGKNSIKILLASWGVSNVWRPSSRSRSTASFSSRPS